MQIRRRCRGTSGERLFRWFQILLLAFFCTAQIPHPVLSAETWAGEEQADEDGEEKEPESKPAPKKSDRAKRYSLLIAAPIVTFWFGSNAWDWGEGGKWRWGKERWFQKDTDSGGADKAGHFFAHYLLSRTLYSMFSRTEHSDKRAFFYSALTTASIGTMIEVGDAFSGKYGFSYEDLISDFVGISLGLAMERYPTLEHFVGITAHYWPSEGFLKEKDKSILNFAGDYSGWQFMMNFKLSGFSYVGREIPRPLRYLQMDLGYYTRNYTNYDKYAGLPPTRHLYYGVSVNFREVASAIPYNGKPAKALDKVLTFYYMSIGKLVGRSTGR